MRLFSPSPTSVVGLVATFLPDEQLVLSGCVLRRQGDTVLLERQFKEISSLAALSSLGLDADAPLAFVLQGRGILIKLLPDAALATSSEAEVLATLMPGAAPADFYVQPNEGNEGHYVSLIRRKLLDELLAACATQQRYVVATELGPFGVQTLLPYLPVDWQDATVQLGNYTVALQNGRVAAIQTAPNVEAATYSIGEDKLGADVLPGYAAALGVLMGRLGAGVAQEKVEAANVEWQQKQLYKRGGIGLLAAFLVVLLVNFLWFTQLTKESQELGSQSQTFRQELTTLQNLQRTVQQQQQFLESAGWLAPTRQSIYADQLAATVPAGLQLRQLDINPVDETSSRQQQEPLFQVGILEVKGNCQEAQILNGWLQALNRMPWIKRIYNQNFTYDYAASMGAFSFTVQLAPATTASR